MDKQAKTKDIYSDQLLNLKIFDVIDDVYFLVNKKGNFNYVSPNVKSLFGYSPKEVIQKGSYYNLFGDSFSDLERSIQSESLTKTTKVIVTKNGKSELIEMSVKPINLGESTALLSCKKITMSINNQQYFDLVVDNIAEGLAIFDENFNIQVVNKSFCQIVGQKKTELVKQSLFQVFPNLSVPLKGNQFHNTTFYNNSTIINKNGKSINCGIRFLRTSNDHSIILIEDHMEQLQLQSYFNSLLDNSLDGIVLSDNDNKLLLVNDVICDMLGYSANELMNMSIADFMTKEPLLQSEPYQAFIRTENSESKNIEQYKTKDGKIIDVRVSSVQVENTDLTLSFIEDITEKVANFIKLDRYKRYFNVSQDSLCIVSEDIFIDVNHQFCETLGYAKDEILGKPYTFIIHSEDINRTVNEVEVLANSQSNSPFNNRVIRKDGALVYLQWNAVFDSKTKMMYASARDVTELNQVNKAIWRSEKKLNIMLDSMPDPVFVASKDFRITKVNKAASKLLGFTKDEFLELNIFDTSEKKNRQKIKNALTVSKPEEPVLIELELKTKSGKLIPTEVHTKIIDIDDEIWLMGVVRDITNRKQILDDLKASETRYRRVFNSITNGYILYDKNGMVKRINPAAKSILGIPNDQINSDDFSIQDFYTDKELILNEWESLSLDDKNHVQMAEVIREDEVLQLRFNKHLITSTNGEKLIEATFEEVTHDYYFNALTKETNKLYKFFENHAYDQLLQYGLDTCEKLMKSEIAFFHFVNEDENAIKLTQWSTNTKAICEVPDLTGHYPIKEAGSWAVCINTKLPSIHNDYTKAPNKGGLPDGHVTLKRDLEVPIIKDGKVKAIIGVGNKKSPYTKLDIAQLQAYSSVLYSLMSRKRDQEELENTKHFLEEASAAGKIGVWIWDVQNQEVWWSDPMKEIHGLAINETTPNVEYQDRVLDEDVQVLCDALKASKETGKVQLTYRFRRYDDNQLIFLKSESKVSYSKEGKVLKHIGITKDVTDQMLHEKEVDNLTRHLELTNTRLNLALENINAISFEMDVLSKELSFVNDQYQSFFDIDYYLKSLDQLTNIIHKRNLPFWNHQIESIIEGHVKSGLSIEVKTLTKDNSWKWKQFRLEVIEWNKSLPKTLFFVGLDIQKEKEMDKLELIAQEQERLRVSRDIHDSIGQMLVGTRFMLNQTLGKKVELEKLEKLNKSIDEMLDSMIKESRMIINNYGVSLANNNTLKDAIAELVNKMYRVFSGSIDLIWKGEEKVGDMKTSTNIFRIFQESLSNTIKYAEADFVKVIVNNESTFRMEIVDDGVGFDIDSDMEGFGMKNMQERAKQINGKIEIKSQKGKGTQIILTLDK